MGKLQENLAKEQLFLRENEFFHSPLDVERRFYDSVRRGDTKSVWELYRPLGGEGFGVLSSDKLLNLKYHMVVAIAFITRYCVDGGMDFETAFSMSDLVIRDLDSCTTQEQVQRLHKDAIGEFTNRMSIIANKPVPYSQPVLRAMEFIFANLNRPFTISEMSGKIGVTSSYLSRLFHRETGCTLQAYILKKRVEEAAKMLLYSEYGAADIAQFLAFSSHSHFISAFKKEYGLTPRQYRKMEKNRQLTPNAGVWQ